MLEVQKRILGNEHQGTLTTAANLAATYAELGQYTEAETLERQVLEVRKRALGNEHPDKLGTADNLAFAYSELGT